MPELYNRWNNTGRLSSGCYTDVVSRSNGNISNLSTSVSVMLPTLDFIIFGAFLLGEFIIFLSNILQFIMTGHPVRVHILFVLYCFQVSLGVSLGVTQFFFIQINSLCNPNVPNSFGLNL
mmetsp:Transcript_59233/g.157298  ORF Transcript_59233/g.157298 Transcript_59233/m.157298 type:complete len:120 (+) Transcript_59233:4404-4763(+)